MIALACAGLLVGAGRADASPAEDAARLNDAGKELVADQKYEPALAKFRAAVQKHAEARFQFNVCFTLGLLERYDEAIAACEQVKSSADADAALLDKTDKALASLHKKAGGTTAPAGGTTPTSTGGTTPPTSGGATPTPTGGSEPGPTGSAPAGPSPGTPTPYVANDPFAIRPREPGYRWSIGAEIGPAVNRGLGSAGGFDVYGSVGLDIRVFTNLVLSQRRQFGVQAFFGAVQLGPGDDSDADSITLADLGAGLFKGFALTDTLSLTPMGGVSFAIQQPGEVSSPFTSIGFRLEAAMMYAGLGSPNAFGATIGATIFGPSNGSSDGFDAEDFNLDQASMMVTVALSYQYRSTTAFGPLVTLE